MTRRQEYGSIGVPELDPDYVGWIDHDVESDAQEIMRANTPPQGGDTLFAQLVKGRTIGKRAIVIVEGAKTNFIAPGQTDMMTIQSDDVFAMPLCITLTPMKAVPGIFAPNADGNSNITGEQDFGEIGQFIWAKAFAILDWGIGGVNSTAEVDYVNGLKINLQASYLRVRVSVESLIAVSGGAYVMGAYVGPAQGGGSTAQRTISVAALAGVIGTLSVVNPIPRFARDFTWYQAAAGASLVDVAFFRDLNASQEVCRQRFAANAPASDYLNRPVPNGANYFRIINQAAVVVPSSEVVFALAL